MKNFVFKVEVMRDLTTEQIDEIIYALAAQVEEYVDIQVSYKCEEITNPEEK